MIVADTNLVAYLLMEGERTAAARRVYLRDPDWRLPPLWRSEFLNVLALSARAQVVSADGAAGLWLTATQLFGRSEVEPAGGRVLEAALARGITAYDAHFVVLAETLGAILVTGDRKLLPACGHVAVSIEDFAASR